MAGRNDQGIKKGIKGSFPLLSQIIALFIRDDGIGMTAEDFQDKFLNIGYSKRRAWNSL